MERAKRKCATCPFRGASDGYKRSTAHLQPEDWPCHTEDLHGEMGIQCRGHWQAVRKFGHLIGPQADEHDLSDEGREEERALMAFQSRQEPNMHHDFRVGETVTRYGDDRCEIVELLSDDALAVICREPGRYAEVGEKIVHSHTRFERVTAAADPHPSPEGRRLPPA